MIPLALWKFIDLILYIFFLVFLLEPRKIDWWHLYEFDTLQFTSSCEFYWSMRSTRRYSISRRGFSLWFDKGCYAHSQLKHIEFVYRWKFMYDNGWAMIVNRNMNENHPSRDWNEIVYSNEYETVFQNRKENAHQQLFRNQL